MDFFARQDRARRHTGILLIYFGLAILATSALVYFVVLIGLELAGIRLVISKANHYTPDYWHPFIFLPTFAITLMVVAFGSILKKSELRGGGPIIATQLGGRPLPPETDNFYERRLRNVVEEMAIASGVPVPQIYVMDTERGINAFAAGYRPSDAVIAVTYGTMVGLTRDELQGVIAHEFSHILNGDMRMNIDLIGWLHGLTAISQSGKGVLKCMEHVRGRGSIALVIVGGALFAVGWIGTSFAGIIKSMVSRQREILADASAVQFTRNPSGLAGALKKIGGLIYGSRLNSWRTQEISHMCFGNGLRGTMFPTHPPLRKRIQWLEPGFDGTFESVTYESLYEQLQRTEAAPRPDDPVHCADDVFGPVAASGLTDRYPRAPGKARAIAASPGSAYRFGGGVSATQELINGVPKIFDDTRKSRLKLNGHQLLESIGQPMQRHEETAKALIASIPDRVRTHAASPYGARMLIYFLLLDSREEILRTQMNIIKHLAEPEVFQTLEKALQDLGTLDPALRLPVIDLTIPALRFLSTRQYEAFMQVVTALAEADRNIDIFEFALRSVLKHHLDPVFGKAPKKPPVNYYGIRGLAAEASVLLSSIARKCHSFGIDASSAFLAGADVIQDSKAELQLLDPDPCTWDRLQAALDKFNESSSQVKKEILAAALACMLHDREITVEEVELFRAIAVTLDCPVPPWVAPLAFDSNSESPENTP
ncbi:M48 family metallopeptidase [Pontiella sp.]|uniref:M48 family metallopeptidase n=1 Tax=Pontiella sp. TaxID=2837462 RepID=UPI003561EABD